MTREEAITQLELLLEYCESMMTSEYPVWRRDCEALQMLIAALRPISRERVEKVWGSCKVCNGEMTLYQYTNTTKLHMGTFGKATTLVTECNACPPHADCCMKGISANSAFIINYCPECGRPLTDEAVEMVMERWKEALE